MSNRGLEEVHVQILGEASALSSLTTCFSQVKRGAQGAFHPGGGAMKLLFEAHKPQSVQGVHQSLTNSTPVVRAHARHRPDSPNLSTCSKDEMIRGYRYRL